MENQLEFEPNSWKNEIHPSQPELFKKYVCVYMQVY